MVDSEPQNVTLLEIRAFANVIMAEILNEIIWIRVGPKSNDYLSS